MIPSFYRSLRVLSVYPNFCFYGLFIYLCFRARANDLRARCVCGALHLVTSQVGVTIPIWEVSSCLFRGLGNVLSEGLSRYVFSGFQVFTSMYVVQSYGVKGVASTISYDASFLSKFLILFRGDSYYPISNHRSHYRRSANSYSYSRCLSFFRGIADPLSAVFYESVEAPDFTYSRMDPP